MTTPADSLRERVTALAYEWDGGYYSRVDRAELALAVAAMVAEHEREACARECDEHTGRPHTFASENADRYRGFCDGATVCAAAIRARKGEI